ncbi:MAG: hypothetical protein RIE59_10650, partial [Imperialibacter sp.]
MSKPNPTKRSFFVTFLGASAALAVLAGFAIIYYVFNNVKNLDMVVEGDITTLSMLGEFVGGTVGSMWSLAGVIFFYLALIYQRRELELQREELLESRKIMDKQSKTLQTQQFENTFFQLLEFHLNAAKRIETQDGSNGFDKMYVDFKKALTATKRK